MAEQPLIDDFVAESSELLEGLDHELEDALTTGESAPLDRIFRAIHTVKGTAGFLGLLNIKNYSHQIEDVLDRLRSGKLSLSARLKNELIACIDLVGRQVDRAATATSTSELSKEEIESLRRLGEAADRSELDEADEAGLLAEVAFRLEQIDPENVSDWLEDLRRLVSPYLKVQESATCDDWLSNAVASNIVIGEVDLTSLGRPCLAFFMAARPELPSDEIVQPFLAAAEELAQRLSALGRKEAAALIRSAAEECKFIHESPIDLDSLLLSTLEEKFNEAITPLLQNVKPSPLPPGPPEPVVAEKAPDDAGSRSGKSGTVRVREETLDQFVWHVGETFLAMETFRDLHSRLNEAKAEPALLAEFNEMNREMAVTVGKLQQSVMAVRRVPAGSLLNRIPSMVRQLGQQLGKQVEAIVEGSEILVDKSLLQELEGPMNHLIRNAMDHGIQPPDERERLGKSPTGTLIVRCIAEKEHVFIDIIDDGRGIDRDRVLSLAVQRGLLSEAQAKILPSEEIPLLLCRPGFSTAAKVSEVSGRGVGLDVVLNSVERNRGKLGIESVFGQGTKFTLTFPLKSTVLMVDGLVCESQKSLAAFSVDHVREVIRITPGMIQHVGGRPTVVLRGKAHAIVTLRTLLDQNGDDQGGICAHGVLLEHMQRSVLVAVEGLNGYRKMVLKDFDRDVVPCDFLSGVALLGGSKMALVFDVPELLRSLERGL